MIKKKKNPYLIKKNEQISSLNKELRLAWDSEKFWKNSFYDLRNQMLSIVSSPTDRRREELK